MDVFILYNDNSHDNFSDIIAIRIPQGPGYRDVAVSEISKFNYSISNDLYLIEKDKQHLIHTNSFKRMTITKSS